MIRAALLTGLALLAGCPNPGPVASPSPYDASDAAAATEAGAATCANLKRLGCHLGSDALCAPTLRTAVTAGVTTPEVIACGGGAPSVPALLACGQFYSGACSDGGHP